VEEVGNGQITGYGFGTFDRKDFSDGSPEPALLLQGRYGVTSPP
jgi:hypothetical protein